MTDWKAIPRLSSSRPASAAVSGRVAKAPINLSIPVVFRTAPIAAKLATTRAICPPNCVPIAMSLPRAGNSSMSPLNRSRTISMPSAVLASNPGNPPMSSNLLAARVAWNPASSSSSLNLSARSCLTSSRFSRSPMPKPLAMLAPIRWNTLEGDRISNESSAPPISESPIALPAPSTLPRSASIASASEPVAFLAIPSRAACNSLDCLVNCAF